uniref:Putative hydroxypyruvate isomerase n=1 Tax=Acrobeloides nanus TaxID=290746 RepID=A0A914D487_9BILA
MRVAASLYTMFTDVPLVERYQKAAKLGFKLVECPFPYTVDAEVLKKEADKYGLKHVFINAPPGDFAGGERGFGSLASEKERFIKSIDLAIHYANVLECKRIHVMAGINRVHDQKSYNTFVENIRYASEKLAKDGIECSIEPINNHTIPGYYLNSMELAVQVLEEVNAPNLKIDYDVFHLQLIQGQLTHLLKKHASIIGHIQVAQVPNRDEPDADGEIDYAYVMDLLKQTNPNWIVGGEYVNTTDDRTGDWVKKFGLEF